MLVEVPGRKYIEFLPVLTNTNKLTSLENMMSYIYYHQVVKKYHVAYLCRLTCNILYKFVNALSKKKSETGILPQS